MIKGKRGCVIISIPADESVLCTEAVRPIKVPEANYDTASFFSMKWAFLFKDGGADAGVGGLDVEHGADRGGDVGHVGEA